MKLKPGLILFLKMSVLFGLSFEMAMIIGDYVVSLFSGSEFQFIVWKSLFRGGGFGLFMGAMSWWNLRKELKKKGFDGITEESIKVRHSTEFSTSISREGIIKKLEKAPVVRKMKVEESHIKIRTNSSEKSPFGEVINIWLQEIMEGGFNIKVISKPVSPFQILDQGINKRNVISLEKLLTQ